VGGSKLETHIKKIKKIKNKTRKIQNNYKQ